MPVAVAHEDRVGTLDGVRGLAATSVFVYHGLVGVPWVVDRIGGHLVHLNVGVRVFFVLSGFLIARPFAQAAFGLRPAPRTLDYALRRSARIFPAYWLTLAVLVVIGGEAFRGRRDLLGQLSLTFLWFPLPGQVFGVISVAGTLAIELVFYVFVPLWFAATRLAPLGPERGRLLLELGGCAVLIGLGGIAIWRAAYGDPGPFVEHFGTALPALAAGMALAIATSRSVTSPGLAHRIDRAVARASLWWIAAGLAFLVLAARDFTLLHPTPGERAWQWTWESIVAVLLVCPFALRQSSTGVAARLMTWRPLVWVGLVSYGLYLWHGWTLSFIDADALRNGGFAGTARAIAFVALAYLGALGLAALSWYALERPLLRRTARRPAGGALSLSTLRWR